MSSKVCESISGCDEEKGGKVEKEDAEKDDSFTGHWPVPFYQTTLKRSEPVSWRFAPMNENKREQRSG